MKKTMSIIIILIVILTTFMTSYADEGTNAIITKDNEASISIDYSKMSSDKILQSLMNKGIQFTVIDTYYEITPTSTYMIEDKIATYNCKVNFREKYTITTKNKIPKIERVNETSLLTLAATSSDVRMREIQFNDGSVVTVSKSAILKSFLTTSFEYVAGVLAPIPTTIYSFISSFGTPIEQYGTSNVLATNFFYRRDTLFEVKDSRGFYTNMLTSETRQTNLRILTDSSYNGVLRSKTVNLAGVVNEYSARHNKLALNIEDACMRFNLGYTTPLVHRYYTGIKIVNKVGF